MSEFELHPDLAGGGTVVGDLALSRLVLINDARYPWLCLVPRRPDLREIFDLTASERAELIEEISHVGKFMAAAFDADKINVGALGNITPQLHVHVIARRREDDAWPGPIWGKHPALPYAEEQLKQCVQLVRSALGLS